MKLVYERRGTGEPLVLVHGIGHHWRAWEPVLDKLAAEHDVIAIDLPGFGQSPVPPEGLPDGMPAVVDGVTRFFDHLGLHRPHVAGNSLGGAIALELAAAGRAASATALSPAGFYTQAELRWALRVLRASRAGTFLPQPVLRTVFRTAPLRALSLGMIFGNPRQLTAEMALQDAIAMRNARAFTAVARAGRTYSFQGRPEVPVTVAWGTRDRVLRYRQASVARQRLPQARHVDLPGCGHVPMIDNPGLVSSLILATAAATRSRPQPPPGILEP
jgi:pimeloyl-ACP methyl ester carboxylesterase